MVKNPPANAEDSGSIPGSGRSPGEGNDNIFQNSCLGNPVDRGAWPAIVHGVAKVSDITQRLNNNMTVDTINHLNRGQESRWNDTSRHCQFVLKKTENVE